MTASPGMFYASLTQPQKEEVLQQVADEISARFTLYMDTAVEASGLKEARGVDRLTAYRDRAPDVWALMQAEFPREYERQMKDQVALERGAKKRLGMMMDSTVTRALNRSFRDTVAASASTTLAPTPRL